MTTNNILVVDDNLANHLAVSTVLKKTPYTVIRALSGNEAISLLPVYNISLILMDVQMPGLNGVQTASLVRQDPRFAAIPIVFMTAYDEQSPQAQFDNISLSHHLYKPFSAIDLLTIVNSLLPIRT